MQDSKVDNESLTGIRSDVATEIGKPNTTTPFVSVPIMTHSNQTSINHTEYSVQLNATQPQPEPTSPDPVSLMAQQIATSKPTSSFTEPVNHVLPNLSVRIVPTTGLSVPHVAISQSAPQGLSGAPNTESDNSATVPQVVLVTSDGTICYLNPSSGPNLQGGAMPINVSSTAPMTIGGPDVVPTVSISRPRTEATVFTVQDGALNYWRPQEKTIYRSGNWRNTTEIPYNATTGSASLKVSLA